MFIAANERMFWTLKEHALWDVTVGKGKELEMFESVTTVVIHCHDAYFSDCDSSTLGSKLLTYINSHISSWLVSQPYCKYLY